MIKADRFDAADKETALREAYRMRMPSPSFAERIAEIDRRVREVEPRIAADIRRDDGPGDSATWARGASRATVVLHHGPPRFQLTLHTGNDQHPDAMEIALDEADVVNMIAVPVVELLAHPA